MGFEPGSEHTVLESLARVRACLERGDRRGTVFAARDLDDALLAEGRFEPAALEEFQKILQMPEFMKSDSAYAVLRAIDLSTGIIPDEQIEALAPILQRIRKDAAEETARHLAASLLIYSSRKTS